VARHRLTLILSAASIASAVSPAGAGASARCETGDLYVSRMFSSATTGHVVHVFRVRNMSGRTCHTFGYFGVRLLGDRGRVLETHAKRVTTDFFGHQRKRRVTIRPGHSGSFRISTTTGAGYHCVHATSVRLIAPDDTGGVTVPLGRRSIDACQHGKIFVAPIQRGNDANLS
jgi:hypothetical protein